VNYTVSFIPYLYDPGNEILDFELMLQ
jgi:hypothetical protein